MRFGRNSLTAMEYSGFDEFGLSKLPANHANPNSNHGPARESETSRAIATVKVCDKEPMATDPVAATDPAADAVMSGAPAGADAMAGEQERIAKMSVRCLDT